MLATSKARQRERLAAAGVPPPRLAPRLEPRRACRFLRRVRADRQGQRGLSLVEDATDLEAAITRAISESRNGHALVEEVADGPEVTVERVVGRFQGIHSR